ncbi:MAG TPA: DUF4394 domain-containing protein [Gemmatimonadales bacterium]|nr:DUF4394 domain-containing protein [Gemmatimonadales bacterium]
MRNTLLPPGLRTGALALLTLIATFAGACGKDGGGLTDPDPIGPPVDPSEPSAPAPGGPDPVGERIWAVDLDNNLLLFGAGDPTVLSMKRRISGVPILKRIIGIGFRPSNGRLYGVGSDSRLYTIDTLTAEATPVSQQPFSPAIVDFFDIHFAMALEPSGNRFRLIAAESGANWSISLDDGTATAGEKARYADGTAYAGETPRLLGIAFTVPLPETAGGTASLSDPCTELMYAIDADRAEMIGSCDPDSGLYEPLGKLPDENYARCGELMWGPDGLTPDDVPPPAGLWVVMQRGVEHLNSLGTVNEDGTITWHGDVPSESPIQSAVFAEGGLYGPRPMDLRGAPRVTAAKDSHQASAAAPRDGRACPGA